jgi:thiamine biosynthesis lipoprotein ApbE
VWWKEIKRICGAQRNTTTLTDHIQDEVVKDLSAKAIADAIDKAFAKNTRQSTILSGAFK